MTSSRKLAHELSNQLGIVISYAELLRGEMAAADPRQRQMETIERAARELLKRFHGLASFDAVEADERRDYRDRIAGIGQSCALVLAGLSATDPVAADLREMIKAADAVAAMMPSA